MQGTVHTVYKMNKRINLRDTGDRKAPRVINVELTPTELVVIWHRLNCSDKAFAKVYGSAVYDRLIQKINGNMVPMYPDRIQHKAWRKIDNIVKKCIGDPYQYDPTDKEE